MSQRPSRAGIILAIVRKDLREFSRDRLWIILTPLALIWVIVTFWILPASVDEAITVGLHPASMGHLFQTLAGGESEDHALKVVPFEQEDRLVAAVSGEAEEDEEVTIGIAFPDDFVSAVRAGKPTRVTVYVDVAVPAEIRRAVSSGIRELAYGLQAAMALKNPASALPVSLPEAETIVVGDDRAGVQVPFREKLRPLLAIIMLMMEAIALAGLVAVEIERRTVTALLVTPARTSDVLAAKGITGALLGLTQVLVFLLATRSFGAHVGLVLVLVVLGAAMASAVGMIAGSSGKDFMSTLFGSIIFVVPLIIPAFSTLFPGSVSTWVKWMPSYGLVTAMVDVMSYGHGWHEVAWHLGTAAAWVVVLFTAALLILKRRVEAL
ncbi:MAG: ABC transporter permease [Deltaproteobacteria bacterium]|nr:ABC transporter permease [Deltaproteobacteria bacterium]